uniref:Uncharacterized protein n=1 Tax=Ditylenchus dipsaci TaxID=166011 RepID=A0A915ERX2_9BILA
MVSLQQYSSKEEKCALGSTVPHDLDHDPCAVVRCSSGPCVVVNGSAVCTNSSDNPCAFTLCRTGTSVSCEMDELGAYPYLLILICVL